MFCALEDEPIYSPISGPGPRSGASSCTRVAQSPTTSDWANAAGVAKAVMATASAAPTMGLIRLPPLSYAARVRPQRSQAGRRAQIGSRSAGGSFQGRRGAPHVAAGLHYRLPAQAATANGLSG